MKKTTIHYLPCLFLFMITNITIGLGQVPLAVQVNDQYDFEILHQFDQTNTIALSNLGIQPFGSGSESLIYDIDVFSKENGRKEKAIVKLMKNNLAPNTLMEETKREYGTMLMLDQNSFPYVPKVYAGLKFVAPLSGPAILMKKYGPDLSTIAGKLELSEYFQLAKNIVKAVDQLHKLGLVHRDLKPENILYDDPTIQSIKIIDFRATRLIGTQSKDASGNPSPIYWIPQYSWLDGKVDLQEDLFSLGLSLFYIKHGFYLQELIFTTEQWNEIQIEALMLLHYKKSFWGQKDTLAKKFPDEIDQVLIRLANPIAAERPTLSDVLEVINIQIKNN